MNQDNIEERIFKAAKAFTDKIAIPEKEVILSKEITRKRNPFVLKKALLTALIAAVILTVSGITVAGLNGINIIDYFFGDPKFQGVQEKGQVNITNMKAEKDGIMVELKAIFSDGDNIYMSIIASGETLDEIPASNDKVFDGKEIDWVYNRIKEIYITDPEGNCWKLKDYGGQNGVYKHEARMKISGEEKNNAILTFYDL